MTKRFRVYFFTALFVLLFAFPAFSAQIVDTGTCGGGGKGENVTWTLYEDGKMEISGEGDVVVLKTASRPWYAYLSEIRTVVIGEGVTSTGKFAFESCENLTSVTLPRSLKTIDSSAFAACKSLSMITIPENVQVIGDYAFAACRNLTTITILEGVQLIDEFAFCECDSLLSMTIPVSVAKIGRSAFSGCDNLSTATLLYGVETIDDFAFYNCQKLEKINLPVSVTSIGGSVFAECHSLTSVILPPQITVIDEGVFAHCATLETVVIPSGVTVIAKFAFDECKMLKNVYYTGTITAWKNIRVGVDNEYLREATLHDSAAVLFPSIVNKSDEVVYTVTAANLPQSSMVVVALYKDGRFVGYESAVYNGEALEFTTQISHDSIAVMAWEHPETLKPLTPVAKV